MNFLKTLFLLLIILPHYVFAQDSELINKPDIDFRREYVVDCEEHGIFHFYLHNKQNKGQYKTNQVENDGFLEGEYYLYGFQYKDGKDPLKQIETSISKKSFKSKYKPGGFNSIFNRFKFGEFKPFLLEYNTNEVFILSHIDNGLNVITYNLDNNQFNNVIIPVGFEFSLKSSEIDNGKLILEILKEPEFLKKYSSEFLIVDLIANSHKMIPLEKEEKNLKSRSHDYKMVINKEKNLVGVLDSYGYTGLSVGEVNKKTLKIYDYNGKLISSNVLPEKNTHYQNSGEYIISALDGFFVAGNYRPNPKISGRNYDDGFFGSYFTGDGEVYFNREKFSVFDFENIDFENGKYNIYSKGVNDMVYINGKVYFVLEFYDIKIKTYQGSEFTRTGMPMTYYYFNDKYCEIIEYDVTKGKITNHYNILMNDNASKDFNRKSNISFLKDDKAPLIVLERGGGSYLEFGTIRDGKYLDLESNLDKYRIENKVGISLDNGVIPVSKVTSVSDSTVIIEFVNDGDPVNSYYHKL